MRRGGLRLVLLDLLTDGPKHGYEIIREVEQRTRGGYEPSAGTVYPALQTLTDEGLVRFEQEGERRIYHLTEVGRAKLAECAEWIAAFWARFGAENESAVDRELAFLQETVADLQSTLFRWTRYPIERGDAAAIQKVRAALEQCQAEIRSILMEAPGTLATDRAEAPPGD
jgi:DNA-binding PadR family transcriptional regulator